MEPSYLKSVAELYYHMLQYFYYMETRSSPHLCSNDTFSLRVSVNIVSNLCLVFHSTLPSSKIQLEFAYQVAEGNTV